MAYVPHMRFGALSLLPETEGASPQTHPWEATSNRPPVLRKRGASLASSVRDSIVMPVITLSGRETGKVFWEFRPLLV